MCSHPTIPIKGSSGKNNITEEYCGLKNDTQLEQLTTVELNCIQLEQLTRVELNCSALWGLTCFCEVICS